MNLIMRGKTVKVPDVEKNWKEFEKHVNKGDHHNDDEEFPLAVCGPLTLGNECLALKEMIICEDMPPGNILEIGSWLGLSTITFALSLKEHYGNNCFFVVHAIDPHDEEHSKNTDNTRDYYESADHKWNMHEVFLSNLEKWDVKDYVKVYREYSFDFNINKADNISMLFIDGDHREKSVYKDLVKFAPLVKEGGLLILHDKWLDSVEAAMNKFKHKNLQEWTAPINIPESDVMYILKKQ